MCSGPDHAEASGADGGAGAAPEQIRIGAPGRRRWPAPAPTATGQES